MKTYAGNWYVDIRQTENLATNTQNCVKCLIHVSENHSLLEKASPPTIVGGRFVLSEIKQT
ncbi:hypothetical protein FACS1894107_12800 [Planctomycetales bacterium]|nr:hypothetical protein FACS1894107_12800 [Planctomycetales bacterium]